MVDFARNFCKPGLRRYSRSNYNISVNPVTPLHGLKRKEIKARRIRLVREYKYTKIFPANYQPKKIIFGEIRDGADWVFETQFFVRNPYLLVLTSAANRVAALLPFCSVKSVKYSYKQIQVKYSREAAKKWFHYIYDYYEDFDGVVRLWFVNAYDAGFNYAHVDLAKSLNVDPKWYSSDKSLIRGIYPNPRNVSLWILPKKQYQPR